MPKRPITLSGVVLVLGLSSLAGCTTYTWPDGSQETVFGVVSEDENKRYEEPRADGVRYQRPGEVPESAQE
ncbi:hypothetical protein [Vreelandella stevensii]|uniref:hypothetical protein n=1 Tax=Vreelandella stevensii TaxID=502821 RepID=UPI00403AE72B